MIERPETRYARSGDVSIAYQVMGEGPRDLVVVPGWISNLEVFWEQPDVVRFYEGLASSSRLITFDKRGTGLSDRVSITELPTLEVRMDDVRAVMDAVGSERAALFGYSEGGPLCALFAATYPERTTGIIMHGSYARRMRAPDYPFGSTPAHLEQWLALCQREWGGPVGLESRAPSRAGDEAFSRWWARMLRMSASPAAAAALVRMNWQIDIRHILPSIRVPALILHPAGDRTCEVACGRYLGQHIPGAKYVELSGIDHVPFLDTGDAVVREVRKFLDGLGGASEPDRVLATIMFADIVGSTERAVEVGDRHWRDLLEGFHGSVRRELDRFRGRELDTAGDGVLAAFDGPARAVRCACAVGDAVRPLGLDIRAGVHTGECERLGDKLAGLAVHIGARVAAAAAPGEVLVSSTVRDLVAGSGLQFVERGTRPLKGVPGQWQLFAVQGGGARS